MVQLESPSSNRGSFLIAKSMLNPRNRNSYAAAGFLYGYLLFQLWEILCLRWDFFFFDGMIRLYVILETSCFVVNGVTLCMG